MRLRIFFVLVLVFVLPLLAANAYADSYLATAGNFGVLGASTVTNTGSSVISGDVGVSPGSAITGFPPGIVNPPGVIHAADAVAGQAQIDATTAYNSLAGLTPFTDLTGDTLGVGPAATLGAGVYKFDSSAQLNGILNLVFTGDNQNIVFQIGSTLTTASASEVLITGANSTDNVFWQVGSSATLGTTTAFLGNIIAQASVTMNTGATDLCGSVIALTGAVTLDSNTISNTCTNGTGGGGGGTIGGGTGGGPGVPAVPEPSTLALLASGLLAMVFLTFRKSHVSSLASSG
jgi:hypothetical protein